MTLEQLTMYLWHEMPLPGWGSIIAAALTLAGTGIYLQGKWIMRENSSYTKTIAISATGEKTETMSSSIGNDWDYGRKIARSGLMMVFFSLVGYIGFMQL